MRRAAEFSITLVTAPTATVARKIAQALLTDRLIACANLLPGIESHYWWKGRCEKGREVLMILKSRTTALGELEKRVLELHPYDTAEVVSFPLSQGTPRYLAWLAASTEQKPTPKKKTKNH